MNNKYIILRSLLKVDFLLPLQHQKILLQKETVLSLWDTEMNWCNYVDITSCTHVPYRDSYHFAIVKAFMVATNFWRQTSSLWFGVLCYRQWKWSICCSARDSWVAIVGSFVEVLHAERKMFWSRWLQLSTSIISVICCRLPWAFITVSVTVINKEGLGKMRIVNWMFLPSAKLDVKKMMVTQSDDDRTP